MAVLAVVAVAALIAIAAGSFVLVSRSSDDESATTTTTTTTTTEPEDGDGGGSDDPRAEIVVGDCVSLDDDDLVEVPCDGDEAAYEVIETERSADIECGDADRTHTVAITESDGEKAEFGFCLTSLDGDDGSGLTPVSDDTDTITVSLPDDWTVGGAPRDGGVPDIVAAPDEAAFTDTYTALGLNIAVFQSTETPTEYLRRLRTEQPEYLDNCPRDLGDEDDELAGLEGRSVVFADCAETEFAVYIYALRTPDGRLVSVLFQATPDDEDLFGEILATIEIS